MLSVRRLVTYVLLSRRLRLLVSLSAITLLCLGTKNFLPGSSVKAGGKVRIVSDLLEQPEESLTLPPAADLEEDDILETNIENDDKVEDIRRLVTVSGCWILRQLAKPTSAKIDLIKMSLRGVKILKIVFLKEDF